MSEFIREVDEEYRQDQIRGLFGRYWMSILALAVLILVGVAAWRGYVFYVHQQIEAAGSRYLDAGRLARDDRAGSVSALDSIVKDGPAGYRLLARFKAAAETARGDAAAGAKAFDALAGDTTIDADLRDLARLRAALTLADTADEAELRRRFEPMADANAPFRNIAREALAVAALKRGDDAAAKSWLDAVMADPVAAQDQRQRAGLFLGLLRSGKPGGAAPVPAATPTPAAPTLLPDPAVPPPAGLDAPYAPADTGPAEPEAAAPSPGPSEAAPEEAKTPAAGKDQPAAPKP